LGSPPRKKNKLRNPPLFFFFIVLTQNVPPGAKRAKKKKRFFCFKNPFEKIKRPSWDPRKKKQKTFSSGLPPMARHDKKASYIRNKTAGHHPEESRRPPFCRLFPKTSQTF